MMSFPDQALYIALNSWPEVIEVEGVDAAVHKSEAVCRTDDCITFHIKNRTKSGEELADEYGADGVRRRSVRGSEAGFNVL